MMTQPPIIKKIDQKTVNKLTAFDQKLESMEMLFINNLISREEYEKNKQEYMEKIVNPFKKKMGLG